MPANFPAFNPGSVLQFVYGSSPETRTVTYETFKAAADKQWLLLGRDAERDGEYRSFRVSKIRRLKVIGG